MQTPSARLLPLLALLSAAMLTGCGTGEVRDSAPTGKIGRLPDDPIPRREARGRYGNGPVYEVFGKRYTVLENSSGYEERGVASWYGEKFHGRLTASRETYDMYQMTAAHKTLPLPTYVRVRSLSNNRSIIVRVNDRGPFVANRVIDLSYAAALKLDMVRNGTSLVEVTAINFDQPEGDRPTRHSSSVDPAPPPASVAGYRIFVQVGAFGSRANANRRYKALRTGGIAAAVVQEDRSVKPSLYRVRIGPINGVMQYDALIQQLADLGITDAILVTL